MATDLYLDTTTHDLVIESGSPKLCAGVIEVIQHVKCGLLHFQGEWFLDEEAGMPYYRDVLVSAPDSRLVEALFRREILSIPEVEQLTSFEMDYTRAARTLGITFEAETSEGDISFAEVNIW